MKKILTLAFALLCMTAVAQNRPTFIFQVGYQGAKITNVEGAKIIHGLRAGVAIDYAFVTSDTYELSLQTGINYSMKGRRGKVGDTPKTDFTARYQYLDLPVLINNRFKLSDTFNAFVNVGPYFAYGLSAVRSMKEESGETMSGPNLFKGQGGDKSALYPFEIGAQVGAGVEVSRVMFGIGTQYGLTKLFREYEGNPKNISFYASVGYRF